MSDFNPFNQPQKIKDARGNYSVLKYDASGNLIERITLKATITPAIPYTPSAAQIVAWNVNGYDSSGNLTSSKRVKDFAAQIASPGALSATGPILAYSYDANKLNATSTSRTGLKNSDVTATTQSATLGYDSLGRLTTGIDTGWQATQFVYDTVDRITRASDRLGKLRDYRFDANGNPLGQQLIASVNGTATLVDSTSARYDDSDRLIAATDAGGFVASTTYDAANNPLSITNPDNYTLGFAYDAANRVVLAYDQAGNLVFINRDTEGKVRGVTDPNGNIRSTSYWDASRDGRLKSVATPAIQSYSSGQAQQYDYDENGNIISLTEIPAAGSGQTNRVSTSQYDELNRPTRSVGPQYSDATLGAICPVTGYAYDSLGRRTQVKAGYTPAPCNNAAGDVTKVQETLAFDDFDRSIKNTDALGKFSSISYDPNNNPLTVIDAKNQTTGYTWSYGHQLVSRIEQGGRTTTYTRNALGQVTQTTHPEASTGYAYDTSHRLISMTDSRGAKRLTYAWSPGGLLNSLSDSDGRITTYLYDPVGRLAAITAPNNDTVNFRFDAAGRLTQKRLPNGIARSYQYNPDNSLKQIVNRSNASTLLSQHDYSYDGVGNRSSQTENIAGSTFNYAYSYDELKRLTQVQNGTSAQQENYTYDAWNNRIQKSIGSPASSTLAYKYDDANQLSEIHSGTLTGPLLSSLSYDNNGNLLSDGARTYTWDALNQLAQVSKGTTSVAYAYDAAGTRLRKVSGGITTQWLYDGQDIYAEYGTAWTNPSAVYTGSGGIDDPLIKATVTGTGSYGQASYYHADGLGSIVALSNSTDSTTQTQRFDAWGNKIAGTIPQSAQFGYTGREPDETGLIYYRARYYDPAIARFTQRDPSGMKGGLNRYAYVNNSPVMLTDPWGLKAASPLSMMLADAGKNYFSNTLTDIGNAITSGYQSFAASPITQSVLSYVPGASLMNDATANFKAGNYGSAVLLGVGALGDAALAVGTGGESTAAKSALTGVAKSAGQLGREGEAAVRSAYDIGEKARIEIKPGQFRIPDGLNTDLKVLSEVKNVQSLSFTKQLRDYSDFARQNGLSFDLYTRPNTQLSGPLKDAIESGFINHLYIPSVLSSRRPKLPLVLRGSKEFSKQL